MSCVAGSFGGAQLQKYNNCRHCANLNWVKTNELGSLHPLVIQSTRIAVQTGAQESTSYGVLKEVTDTLSVQIPD